MEADTEGCPCCIAGVDLDELASAVASLGQQNTADGHGHGHEGQLPDFSSATHWGIFLGVSCPSAVLGLTAAFRNVKGSWSTARNLKAIIQAVDEAINVVEQEKCRTADTENVASLEEQRIRLLAFRDCLSSSYRDATFNLVVPGLVNGAASALVLTTGAYMHPYALPMIAVYAACQSVRNLTDLAIQWNELLSPRADMDEATRAGLEKINQITRRKRAFYGANSALFAIFTAGAVLTFTGAALLPAGGAGAIILPIGLTLLTVGAIGTGILNNRWPEKFKPRNGNLGISRWILTPEGCIKQVGLEQKTKSTLKQGRAGFKRQHLRKFGLKTLSSIPFCEHKSSDLRAQANWGAIGAGHKDTVELKRIRWEALKHMSDATQLEVALPHNETWEDQRNHSDDQSCLRALSLLECMGLLSSVANNLAERISHQSGSKKKQSDEERLHKKFPFIQAAPTDNTSRRKCGHGHSHSGSHTHIHPHIVNRIPSMSINAAGRPVISVQKLYEFLCEDSLSPEQKQALIARIWSAIDYTLFYQEISDTRYRLYGLADFFWALKKRGSAEEPQEVIPPPVAETSV